MGSPDKHASSAPHSAFRRGASAALFAGCIAITAGLCGVAGPVGRAFGAEPDSEAARLVASINERLAKLGLKPHSGVFVSEKALRVRQAIKDRQYGIARQIVAEVLADSRIQNWRLYPFEPFVKSVSDTKDLRFEERLSEWVERDRSDSIAVLMRAQYYNDLAWSKRGTNFAQETQGDRMAAFVTYTSKALAEIDTAIKLNDQNPYAFLLKLRILHGFGASKNFLTVFEEAVAKFPAYYSLYEIALGTLEPRWGGTIEALYDFVDRHAGPAPNHSPLRLLYLSLYRSLLSSAWINCNNQKRNKDKLTECIALFMQQTIVPRLEREVKDSLQLYDHTNRYQFGIAIENILDDLLAIPGGEAYSGAVLELAAGALHSNTQLQPDVPGQNSYIIDKAVGNSWFQKGFYDNALTKYQQALQDVDLVTFPDSEERDFPVAAIYDRLARAHSSLHQHIDTIVYEKAAVMLGAKTGNEHFICYGYYQLKLYATAIDACTEAIDSAGNFLAHYWRGRAYQDWGKLEAALADFAVIADSDSGFRTHAAISMSVIYDNLKDFRQSLDVLNKYTFLYDVNTQNKNDIAASYNNRCFAYMELGDLKKALEDCTASLKYGSLPDAYRKQQELVKRLKAPDKDL